MPIPAFHDPLEGEYPQVAGVEGAVNRYSTLSRLPPPSLNAATPQNRGYAAAFFRRNRRPHQRIYRLSHFPKHVLRGPVLHTHTHTS